MNKYDKTAALAKDLIELCKKHNVSLLHAPGMIKKRGPLPKKILEHSLMNFFVLDCSKETADNKISKAKDSTNKRRIKRQLAIGSKATFPNSVVIKLQKNRKHD